jgi:hypothetical protein
LVPLLWLLTWGLRLWVLLLLDGMLRLRLWQAWMLRL